MIIVILSKVAKHIFNNIKPQNPHLDDTPNYWIWASEFQIYQWQLGQITYIIQCLKDQITYIIQFLKDQIHLRGNVLKIESSKEGMSKNRIP